ncbi:response regulator [Pseudoalteromonas denitrificans]|uniref:CheY chemotaxis protein or a CheY-like REC (Receiver) domain n=1 Tax=Pseudoalteromonas denitrificans DSM 6059 TaxID=1123010 RepID=A0A1I1KZM2_9GAMM|nr:response regulator [Pseudoalteromonas denitrificans]SFC66239.1 CheY chemotaxis protein or a CheY-like REC (receiver) domain [Pseudoalteromonas denitrificans DSM 6059]
MLDIDFSTKKALIIESYKVFRDLIKNSTMKLGIGQVDCVRNSFDALSNCKDHDYDIIYLGYDLGEGKKNGQQTLEELRVNGLIKRTCTVIMITAESSQEMVLCAMEHKPDTYLTKPFTTKELLRRLIQTMDKKAALSEIYLALDNANSELVLTLCDAHLMQDTNYRQDCLKIKSQQLFKLGEFAATEEICERYTNDANCLWAAIGLGKVYMEYRLFDKATHVFKKLLLENPLYIPGYEWLAKNYKMQGDFELSKSTLEKAIETSPRSVSLIQEYASVCEQNTNYDNAITAYKKTLDLSKNSIHHTPKNGLNFARAMSDYSDLTDELDINKLTQQVFRELTNINRDFKNSENKILTTLASACLFFTNKDKHNATKALQESANLCDLLEGDLPRYIALELAKAYMHFQIDEKAEPILLDLVEKHKNDDVFMLKVDQFLQAPLSQQGKAETLTVIKIAVKHYNQKNYQDAVTELSLILSRYPNHVSIKLNLIEALLKSVQHDDFQNHLTRANQLMVQLNKLPRKNEHFQRMLDLRKKLSAISVAKDSVSKDSVS